MFQAQQWNLRRRLWAARERELQKTLSFIIGERVIVIAAARDVKIDNSKYKKEFSAKAKMLKFEDTERLTGHMAGGVCPFALKEGVEVYLDESLKRFETVFPACGSSNSAVEMTIPELEKYSKPVKWVDVTKSAA